jgi:hypothetical protein
MAPIVDTLPRAPEKRTYTTAIRNEVVYDNRLVRNIQD